MNTTTIETATILAFTHLVEKSGITCPEKLKAIMATEGFAKQVASWIPEVEKMKSELKN